MTSLEAIHTVHAAAIIHLVFCKINTRRFALSGTESAGVTFTLIDSYFEKGEAGKKAQHCSHRTDAITVGPATCPGE